MAVERSSYSKVELRALDNGLMGTGNMDGTTGYIEDGGGGAVRGLLVDSGMLDYINGKAWGW